MVGPSSLMDLAIHRGRSYMFSTAMPAVMAKRQLVPWHCSRRWDTNGTDYAVQARAVRQQLKLQGWETGGIDSPIIPIYTGAEELCVEIGVELMKQGLLVPAIRPPNRS